MHHSIMWNTSAVLVLIMFLVVEVKGFSPHLLQSRTRTRTEYTTTRTHRHTDTAEPVAPSEQIVQKSNGFELAAEVVDPVLVSDEWELDFYSRPVIDEKGKKLWEVLLCDKSGNYRVARNMPSNLVNSRELRRVVQEIIDVAPKRPRVIRYFRKEIFNMISIALDDMELEARPSRATHKMFEWLRLRESEVYPKMSGYKVTMKQKTFLDFSYEILSKLPDQMRGEKYAFVTLPGSAFINGEINTSNIGSGKLCPLWDLKSEDIVHGILVFSQRAQQISAWMGGLELVSLRADMIKRQLILEEGLDTRYIMARIQDPQRREAQVFERGKFECNGLHFFGVQTTPEDEINSFWLLRECNLDDQL